MKCLSVKQPWASLIASGRKTIELRTWCPKYRGPLIICAGASRSRTPNALLMRAQVGDDSPLSVAVCLVELIDVHDHPDAVRACCATLEPDELAWELQDPRPLLSIPVKGQLGLFAPPVELLSRLGIE